MTEPLFHLLFVMTFLGFMVIRVHYHRKAMKTAGQYTNKEGRFTTILRGIAGLSYILTLLAYMVYPPILIWAAVPLPDGLRWVGAALSLAVLPLIRWVQESLGSNFSTTIHIRDEHTLVTRGPYRWVRHPMYTVLMMQSIGLMLLTANWFVGGSYLLVLMIIMIIRTPFEENMMIEKFGEQYRAYMRQTGKFLPKLIR